MPQQADVLVIGGGIIGLSIALELRLLNQSVTVLSRDLQSAATQAAAGMLAPQAERLPLGAFLDLCLRSRALYPTWVRTVEHHAGQTVGYWPCGILSPCLDPHAQDWATVEATDSAQWLTESEIHQHQSGLGERIVGGWWFPQDAQVDNRALAVALQTAVQNLGVFIQASTSVTEIQSDDRKVTGVVTASDTYQAEQYVLATGAWLPELLPLPIFPIKGQMLSVRLTHGISELPLQRVLYGPGIYIVPRQDGRIIIGATSESVGFQPHNTAAGIHHLLQGAIQIFPRLQDCAIEELWWGFRPSTPDEQPILGESSYSNLTLATGHYRNGILLAPITAQLIADWIVHRRADSLLHPFSYRRFVS